MTDRSELEMRLEDAIAASIREDRIATADAGGADYGTVMATIACLADVEDVDGADVEDMTSDDDRFLDIWGTHEGADWRLYVTGVA